MPDPRLVLLVRIRTALPLDEVLAIAQSRADEFRALGGLLQKFYLHDPSSGEFVGLYLWDSEESFTAYRASELRRSIANAYQARDEPRIEVLQVVKTLRTQAD